MPPTGKRPLTVVAAVALLAGSGALGHAQSADVLAKRLASLRAEVEELSEDLAEQKRDTRNELQSLARQKADMKVELDREKIRVKKLRATLDKKRQKVAEASSQGEDLAPIYSASLAEMRTYVSGSLPFRTAERLAELDKIEEQRRTGILSYPRALTRLWSFIEDEFRMTRESAAFQQTITVDGEEQLAEVVRIGMVMLFFKTNDGELGYTRKTADGWTFVRAADGAERKQIRKLFDSFRKQIRVGLFTLPNALPEVSK